MGKENAGISTFAFIPESNNKMAGFLAFSGLSAPSRSDRGRISDIMQQPEGDYSCGYSSGFEPDSLLFIFEMNHFQDKDNKF